MKRCLCVLLALGCAASPQAQSSASYQIDQGTFNNGGNPSPVLSSASFQMTLDAIGDGLSATDLASASYGMDAGFPPDYRPPGEVLNLRFPGKTTLTWKPETSVGSYNLYRGALSALPGNYGTKVQSGLVSPTATDSQNPDPGQCLIYLVTASNRLNEEGTKGADSDGDPRP